MNQPMPSFRSALIAAATLLLVSVAAADTLRRGAVAEPNSLDPQIVSGASSTIMRDLFTGLTSYDSAGRLVPGAAESWEISADGLTYRFRLRENLKWSDGSPIAAKDFVYTLRRLLTPGNRTRFGSFFYSIRNARSIMSGELDPADLGVRAENGRTVVIELERPDATLLRSSATMRRRRCRRQSSKSTAAAGRAPDGWSPPARTAWPNGCRSRI